MSVPHRNWTTARFSSIRGMKGLFGQYNKDGDLLAQFKMT